MKCFKEMHRFGWNNFGNSNQVRQCFPKANKGLEVARMFQRVGQFERENICNLTKVLNPKKLMAKSSLYLYEIYFV